MARDGRFSHAHREADGRYGAGVVVAVSGVVVGVDVVDVDVDDVDVVVDEDVVVVDVDDDGVVGAVGFDACRGANTRFASLTASLAS